jgi:hypothetical protein
VGHGTGCPTASSCGAAYACDGLRGAFWEPPDVFVVVCEALYGRWEVSALG